MASKGLDISPDHDQKVLKEIITEGEGDKTPCKGNKVFVHYTGTLEDGTKFDSSVDRGELFEFTLGKGEVIKAWDVGVASMKKGEKCRLTCHSDFAYGASGSPPKIPANATLIFEVELFKWEMEDISSAKDKGILRNIIKDGSGFAMPNEGANVEVHLVGSYNGKQFEDRDLKFELGDGSELGVVEGVEIALGQFKEGEQSQITLSSKYAFGEKGKPDFDIPADASVEYEVTLKSFEKEKDAWSMSSEEKLEQSEIAKEKGTNYFKNCKYQLAVKQYKKIVSNLESETDSEKEEDKEKRHALLLAGYLNLAACYLKLDDNEEVVLNCDKALVMEPSNAKGYFRKGQAYLATKDYGIAKDCFERVLQFDASNKAAQKNVLICKDNLKKELAKEKKLYQTMFKKLAEEPDTEIVVSSSDNKNEENGVVEMIQSEGQETITDAVTA